MQQTTVTAASVETCKVGVVIGLDLGDRWSRYCVLDEAGAVVEENRVRSHTDTLRERFATLPPHGS